MAKSKAGVQANRKLIIISTIALIVLIILVQKISSKQEIKAAATGMMSSTCKTQDGKLQKILVGFNRIDEGTKSDRYLVEPGLSRPRYEISIKTGQFNINKIIASGISASTLRDLSIDKFIENVLLYRYEDVENQIKKLVEEYKSTITSNKNPLSEIQEKNLKSLLEDLSKTRAVEEIYIINRKLGGNSGASLRTLTKIKSLLDDEINIFHGFSLIKRLQSKDYPLTCIALQLETYVPKQKKVKDDKDKDEVTKQNNFNDSLQKNYPFPQYFYQAPPQGSGTSSGSGSQNYQSDSQSYQGQPNTSGGSYNQPSYQSQPNPQSQYPTGSQP